MFCGALARVHSTSISCVSDDFRKGLRRQNLLCVALSGESEDAAHIDSLQPRWRDPLSELRGDKLPPIRPDLKCCLHLHRVPRHHDVGQQVQRIGDGLQLLSLLRLRCHDAKSVLPKFTRYSKSKARSVHESMSAVQIGDTPNRVESPINRGVQPGDCCFNRTLVQKSHSGPIGIGFSAISCNEYRLAKCKSPDASIRAFFMTQAN